MEIDPMLRELARVANAVGPSVVPASYDELLRSIAEGARTLLRAGGCSLALLEGEELAFHVVAGGAGEEIMSGMRMRADEGIAGWALSSGQPVAVHDVEGDPRFSRDVAEATGYMPKSILAMPLETDRQVVGVIEVLDPHDGGPADPDDMAFLALFAEQAALAIETQQAFSELGRVLLKALARSAHGADLVEALERVAGEPEEADPDLEELARNFAELQRVGPTERRAALRLMTEFLEYVRSAPRRR